MLELSRLPNGQPEIFASIQGEGITAGVPSVFVRLALCNLRCTWCDTKHTWDWTSYDRKARTMMLRAEDIARRVQSTRVSNVVITGGEPLLQQRRLVDLVSVLKECGLRIEVETNGTFQPDSGLATAVDQWNVSPKLANSGNDVTRREVATSLAWFAAKPHAYFKFVVARPSDLDEVRAIVARYRIPAGRVLLMPEATTVSELARHSRWLVKRCCESGYRLGSRLQVLIWDETEGEATWQVSSVDA